VPKTWPELDKGQQALVSGASRPLLMPGNNQTFFSNETRRMSEQARLALLDDFFKLFTDDLKHKLNEPEVASELDVCIVRLNIKSAADLWLSLRVNHSHWNQLAAGLNKQLPTKETYKRGRVMPRTDTIMKWLINNGARLQFEYVLGADMIYVGSEELYVVHLASDDELEDDVPNVGAADLAATEDAQKPNKGYLVKKPKHFNTSKTNTKVQTKHKTLQLDRKAGRIVLVPHTWCSVSLLTARCLIVLGCLEDL
jgi:hypothetical protein